MQTKHILGHAEATRILAAARAHAQAHQWAVSIAVVDDGGHLLALERLDGAAASTAYLCTEKARSTALTRRESGDLENIVKNGRVSFLCAPLLTPLEGAVPVVHEGQVIGAVGVSGVRSSDDAEIARAGVAALG
ncbi:heme-binding protein [Pseudomonas sp. KNUC1026]|uniref:heme-binding protein n=1 Tax=Pseudomonas sp. KNUC1026 TaxID=2893890 RepID=UPI001F2C74AC|nr:heme-binding protein [Pseudomonas sp. KNUC1026]UFH48054.1 heme-binding protein [Pseudomonas sp. KNUC1026]